MIYKKLPTCKRCAFAYYSIYTDLLQCKKRETNQNYFKDGVCSVWEYENCKYYKERKDELIKPNAVQKQLNFDM